MSDRRKEIRAVLEEHYAASKSHEPTHKHPDAINPAHYKGSYPFEVIDLIEKALTPEQFQGYLLGNELKYRLRAGIKTADFGQDMLKAGWYRDRRSKEMVKSPTQSEI
ncbi:MAG: DUF3310 domain-containing protein [Anaerolineales bacterium]